MTALSGASPSAAWAQRAAVAPEEAFAQAMTQYAQQLYPSARAAFAAFRRAHPTHASAPQALYMEASSALALEQEADAARLFRLLQETYPRHPRAQDAQLRLGQYFIEQGNRAQGRQQLQSILDDAPGSDQAARALYLLGQAAEEEGDDAAALSYYQQVLDDDPDAEVTPAAAYAAGTTNVRLGNYEDAASAFEALTRRFPETPYAQNVGTALAEVYYELGRYDEVVEELNKRLSPLSGTARARAVFLLAEAHHQQERYGQAQEFYRQLIDAYPDNPYRTNARYGLAWVDYRTGRHRAAAQEFSQVRSAPAASDSLRLRATYYEAVNRSLSEQPDAALELYRTFGRTWPNSDLADDALYETVLLHYKAERYADATRALRSLLERYPTSDRVGEAYYWLGNANLAQQNLDAALDAYTQASTREAAPDSVLREVRFQEAWTQYEDGRYAESAAAFASLAENAADTRRGRDALFWAADSHYQTGNYARAQTLLLRYLNRYPSGRHAPAAQYVLGWTHFEQQQYRPAARAFRQFLDSNAPADDAIPYRKDARLRLADSYFALKRYDEAVEAYRSVGGTGADYALYQAAQALNRDDQPRRAIETYQELADLYPGSRWHQEALYRVGYLYFQQQDYRRARQTYRDLLERFPESRVAPQALYGIGDTHYNAGDLEQAADVYQQVLARYPDAPIATEAASSLFFALDAMGRRDRASAVVDSFAAENPTSNVVEELRFRRAETAYQSGRIDEALRLFRQFLRTSTDESLLPEAYYYLGLIYDDRNDPSQAVTYLTPIVEQYPESRRHGQAALRLGDLRMDQERYDAALSAYRTAAESATGEGLIAQARYGQSTALLQLGRTDEAEQLLQRVLENSTSGPLQASAQLGLARIHEQEGRTDAALSLYQTVANRSESETGAEALFRLGRLYAEQGQPRQAITTLERMSALFAGYPEWNARALLAQANAHRALGQTDEAAVLYDKVLQEHAGTRFAQTAQSEKDAL
jgi:TolA-binding protein